MSNHRCAAGIIAITANTRILIISRFFTTGGILEKNEERSLYINILIRRCRHGRAGFYSPANVQIFRQTTKRGFLLKADREWRVKSGEEALCIEWGREEIERKVESGEGRLCVEHGDGGAQGD